MNQPSQVLLPPSTRRWLAAWTAGVLLVLFSILMIRAAGQSGIVGAVLVALPPAVVLWLFGAHRHWWAVMPIAYSFGGVFYFGFKINVYEVALVLSLAALLPVLLTTSAAWEKRPRPPAALVVLLVYFCLHAVVSAYLCVKSGMGGVSSVARVYLAGLWAMLFAFLFLRFGSTRGLRWVLLAMYIAAFARVAFGYAATYGASRFRYVPIINLILPGSVGRGIDLRASALLVLSFALGYASLARPRILGVFHLGAAALSGWMILLGGSRVSLVAFLLIVLVWLVVQRHYVALGLVAVAVLGGIVALNQDPAILYRLPLQMQRTLTGVIVPTRTSDVHRMVEGSNAWHFELMRAGRERWLRTPVTVLVGNRLTPYDARGFAAPSSSIVSRVDIAAGLGTYEAGLWTVLAVGGILAAILYIAVFWRLLRRVVPDLLRHRIDDYTRAFSFLAVSALAVWVCLCWISGHFPSQELMLAAIAYAACEDRRRSAAPESPAP